MGNAGGEFDDLDAARHLALGVGEHLAVLGRDQAGQVVAALVQQFQELEHDPRTAQRRGIGPGREGHVGSGHGGVDFCGTGQGHTPGYGAGGGVEHVSLAATAAVDGLSVDMVSKDV